MNCFFDNQEKCDFFFVNENKCYLGNFNQDGPIGSSEVTLTTYIHKGNFLLLYLSSLANILNGFISDHVGNMLEKLFPTSLMIPVNTFSTKLHEKFPAVSLFECAAHAKLALDNIDYFAFINEECLLGNLPDTSDVINEENVEQIWINRQNSWNDLNSRFSEQFTLSSYIWTKYIYETFVLELGQDRTECGIRCELLTSHCDFFTVASGMCYLGRYSHWDSGIVEDLSIPITYHNSRKNGIQNQNNCMNF